MKKDKMKVTEFVDIWCHTWLTGGREVGYRTCLWESVRPSDMLAVVNHSPCITYSLLLVTFSSDSSTVSELQPVTLDLIADHVYCNPSVQ
jgi:hypothetical protein